MHDHHTSTPSGAAAFEARESGDPETLRERVDVDPADWAHDRRLAAAKVAADRRAAERGEYVPSASMALTVQTVEFTLSLAGVKVAVAAYKEGAMTVRPLDALSLEEVAERIVEKYPAAQTAIQSDVLYVRLAPLYVDNH